jgi:hypothetical protein
MIKRLGPSEAGKMMGITRNALKVRIDKRQYLGERDETGKRWILIGREKLIEESTSNRRSSVSKREECVDEFSKLNQKCHIWIIKLKSKGENSPISLRTYGLIQICGGSKPFACFRKLR